MESYSQVVLFFVHKNEPGGLHACMKAHSANAHQQVIWLRGISNAGGSRWVGKACGVDTSDEDKIFEDYQAIYEKTLEMEQERVIERKDGDRERAR